MTDEQINEAITQATGLWDYPYSSETKRMYDFCSDLNAMHEAEKTLLDAGLLFEYGMHISIDHRYDYLLRATARQRAEAFLRTLGKWNDQCGDTTEMVKEAHE